MTVDMPCYPKEGIIVEATLNIIRKGANRVLCEFTETIFTEDGSETKEKTLIDEGDHIVFREGVEVCPALLVVTKLGDDLWYVIASAECAAVKCNDRLAMKCSRLNSQNLRIFRDCVSQVGTTIPISTWRIELTNSAKIQMIIDRATERWTHE